MKGTNNTIHRIKGASRDSLLFDSLKLYAVDARLQSPNDQFMGRIAARIQVATITEL